MPDIISHWLLGKRILNEPGFKELFHHIDKEAFIWGCQGPDVLFFHRMMPWQSGSLRKYGSSVHSGNPSMLFNSLAKVCRYCSDRLDFNLILSYCIGFCSHYCYDRLVHPFVHYNMELFALRLKDFLFLIHPLSFFLNLCMPRASCNKYKIANDFSSASK